MDKYIDLTGQKFGRLTVSKFVGTYRHKHAIWECKCDCGTVKQIRATSLQSGNTQSCGCLSKEKKSIGYGLASAHQVFSILKANAKERGYSVEITFEEAMILFKQPCYYCGTDPAQVKHTPKCNGDFIYNGIDRADNTRSYVLDNCVPCCGHCNVAKNVFTEIEFKEWLTRTYKFYVTGELR